MKMYATFAVLSLWATGVAAAEQTQLTAHIEAVTVYADRAQVTRSAAIELSSDPGRYIVSQLPGWVDAESVRVALDPPGMGQVFDVAVRTDHLAQSSEQAVRQAQAAVQQVADEIAAITDEERTLTEEIQRLEMLRATSMDRTSRELAVGEVKVKSLSDTMAYITETIRGNRKQLRSLAKQRRDLQPVLQQKQLELSELETRSQLQQTSVLIEVRGSGKGRLRVSYLTPGASWEPMGELRVTKNGTAVGLQQFASVVQTTGEDWTGAALAFSTQSPDDVLDVPRAHGLMLDRHGAGIGEVVGRMAGSFSQAQTVYAKENEKVARGKDHWRASLDNQYQVQQRAVESFAQLTKRGTTAHFAALSDRPVRSDGKPVRVPIASVDLVARPHIVAVPEVSLNAVRVAELTNGAKAPILPGRAALFNDGAFVGSSELAFAAPGESFSVFLGMDDRIKLERNLDKKTSVLRRSGKRTEMELAFVVTVENLGSEAVSVDLSERIPVAQAEEIDVSDVETPRKVKPDAKGVVRWTEVIAPRSKVSFRVSYTLEYPSDFVSRRKIMDQQDRRAPAASPAAPKQRQLYEQIDMLEHAL